jgi:flagellum-specific ATP synthase
MSAVLSRATEAVKATSRFELRGSVSDVRGMVIEGSGPFVPIGTHVQIHSGLQELPAQVVGFRKDRILLMPFTEMQGIAPGAIISAGGIQADVPVSEEMLGGVFNALGEPIDGRPSPTRISARVPLYASPPNPVTRRRIDESFDIGVRSINALLTMGVGQRIGIMAGSGVGKSTLLGMIARQASSDINVIGLVGERGREVREFIERDLGPEGLARSVVFVATGNESALLRIRAAFLATAVAEYFRDQGNRVVLMVDSITRLAMAQREIGLAIGEPPSTRGYTPSVFSLLPKLLERAGTSTGQGSITGIYTVLVEGDDMNEPVADATRGILDGHIVLSRQLAARNQYPAIAVLESASRVMNDIVSEEDMYYVSQARDILSTYREAEDLISIGAYKAGNNPRIDRAVSSIDALMEFLKQTPSQRVSMEDSWVALRAIIDAAGPIGLRPVQRHEAQ